MKIQALVAAIAIAFAGGAAFAQSSSAGGSGTASTPSTATNKQASTNAATSGKPVRKTHVAKRRHRVIRHHKRQHVSSAARNVRNSRHMGAAAAPQVNLNANDRQARMDQAYQDWKKNHG